MGGAQERGLRSGTVPAPLAVGFGAAAELAGREMAADKAHVSALAHRLYDGITSRLQVRSTQNAHVWGSSAHRITCSAQVGGRGLGGNVRVLLELSMQP